MSAKSWRRHLLPLSHHAYLLIGDHQSLLMELESFLEKELKIKTQGNPDFDVWQGESFGIDDSKTLISKAAAKPLGEKRFFVIAVDEITREAQNSLLKLFEEPNDGIHCFLVLPPHSAVLLTLRSRLFELGANGSTAADAKTVDEFLKAAPPERLNYIKNLLSQNEESNAAGQQFLSGLEVLLADYLRERPEGETADALREVIKARRYSGARGVPLKMLLEHLVFVLPVPRNRKIENRQLV